jgi:hypothetical protein
MERDGCRIRERRGAPCQQQQPCPNATTTRARLVLCDVRPGRGFERRVQAFAPGVLWRAGSQRSAQRLARFGHCDHHCFASFPVSTPRTRMQKEAMAYLAFFHSFFFEELKEKSLSAIFSVKLSTVLSN